MTNIRFVRELVFVKVRATQEWNAIENVLLEPFEPEIDHRRNKQRDHLRKDQAADDNQTERTSRRSILTKTEREGNRTHQRGEGSHHDRAKSFDARFMNC